MSVPSTNYISKSSEQSDLGEREYTSLIDQRILSILISIAFIVISWNLVLLITQQPTGYVIDIYSTLPGYFFPSLVACFLIGSIVVLGGNFRNRNLGILLLIFTQLTILIIPFMLGYHSMDRYDDMSYTGEFAQIANSGNIAGWDIYPSSLIFGAAITIISGLAVNQSAFIIPILFSFIFTLGIILCSRIVTSHRIYSDIVILSAFILYLGPYNFYDTPNALFFAFLPLFIYVIFRYVKERTITNTILLLIMTILMPFTHPFVFFFAFTFILALIILNPLLKRFSGVDYRKLAHPLLIMIVGFLSWFIYCYALLEDFRRSYVEYTLKATQSVLGATTGKLSVANFDIQELSKLFLIYYGRYIIPLIVVAVILVYLFWKKERTPIDVKKKLYFLLTLYLIDLFVEATIFLNPFITHEPDRITNLNFTIYAQIPLFAYTLFILFGSNKNLKKAVTGFAIIILIISTTWALSLYGAFDSPNTFEPNEAMTYNEIVGMKWLYAERNTLNTSSTSGQLVRFHDLLDDHGSDNDIVIPDHFGYNNTKLDFSELILKNGQQTNLVVTTFDKLLYQKVPGYSYVGRYTKYDFVRLACDPSVEKLYNGLNIEMYHSSRY